MKQRNSKSNRIWLIQIQHLLKLNQNIQVLVKIINTIQIQHLLKLNNNTVISVYQILNSNTTLVKVKFNFLICKR